MAHIQYIQAIHVSHTIECKQGLFKPTEGSIYQQIE